MNLILAILILTSSVAIMSTDIYTPSLAHLPDYFGTDAATVKLTMSLNGLVYALATLLYGPLSERYGRRPVLLWGMTAFTLFSFLCGTAATIGGLIAMRIFQGLTAAVEGVVVLAVIRDVFDDRDQIRALAWYGAATALTAAAAPILGGYITIWFGWRMTFFIVALVAFLTTVLIWRFLPESMKPEGHALRLRKVIADYIDLLRNREYMRYVLIGGADLAFFFAFVTAGPFILIRQHGLPTEYFGYFQGLLVIAFICGNLIALKLSHSRSADQLLLMGIASSISGTLLLAAAVFGGMETPASLAVACALIALGDGLVFATTPSLAMNATSSNTGAAAAMLLCIEVGLGGLAALAVGVFHDGTSRPLAWTVVALGVLMVVCYPGGTGSRASSSRPNSST